MTQKIQFYCILVYFLSYTNMNTTFDHLPSITKFINQTKTKYISTIHKQNINHSFEFPNIQTNPFPYKTTFFHNYNKENTNSKPILFLYSIFHRMRQSTIYTSTLRIREKRQIDFCVRLIRKIPIFYIISN